ncbi:tape measure protein [Alloscardovia omnicolens]|uniref:tape measure protein n=2 Tax=Alloscardovia omnicolens TaxID=419015 RepID=UPI000668D8E1|nr:tape measure protein [Alloscardovia omnicolens]
MTDGILLAKAYVPIVPSMEGVGASIKSTFGGSMMKTAALSAGNNAGGGFSKGFAAVQGTIIGVASSIANKAFSTISGSIGSAVSRADAMNNFPLIMQNLGYKAEDAAASVKKISKNLDGLPTTMSDVTGMVTQLAPLTSSLDEATNISLALNNALLAGGKPMQTQSNAMQQYTQMLAAGKVDMQAWRSMMDAMPGQLNQLAVALLGAGHNQNDLYDAMKTGKVSFDQFNDALIQLNTKGVNGLGSFEAQARASTQGIGTAMTNMQNRVSKAVQKVIEAVGVNDIANGINNFSSQFNGWGDTAANAVTTVKNYLKDLWAALQANGAAQTFMNLWNTLSDTLKGFISQAQGIGSSISALAPPETTANIIKNLADTLQWFVQHGDVAANALIAIGGGFVALKTVNAVSTAVGNMRKFTSTLNTAIEMSAGASNAFGKIHDALTVMGSTGGVTQFMGNMSGVATAMKNASGVLPTLKAGLTGLSSALGMGPWGLLAAAIAAVVAGLVYFFTQTKTGQQVWQAMCNGIVLAWNTVVSWFSSAASAIQNAWNAVVAWFQNAGDTIVNGWNTTVNAIQAAWNAVGAFFQPIIDTIVQAWQGFLAFLQPVFDAAQELFSAYIDAVTGLWTTVWGVIQPILQTIATGINIVWNTIVTTLTVVWQTISAVAIAVWTPIAQFFTLVWTGIQTVLTVAWTAISTIAQTVWNGIVNTITLVWAGVQAYLTGVWNTISAIATGTWTFIVNTIQTIWTGFVTIITSIASGMWTSIQIVFITARNVIVGIMEAMTAILRGDWQGAWNAITGIFQSIWNGLTSSLRNYINTIGNVLSGIKNAITGVFTGAGDWLTGIGRNIIDGLINGINGALNTVKKIVGGLGNMIPDWLKQMLGIHSPSRVMRDQIGIYIPQGIAQGIDQARNSVKNAMQRLNTTITSTQPTPLTYTPQLQATMFAGNGYASNGHAGVNGVVSDKFDRLIALLEFYLPLLKNGQETDLSLRDLKRLMNGEKVF